MEKVNTEELTNLCFWKLFSSRNHAPILSASPRETTCQQLLWCDYLHFSSWEIDSQHWKHILNGISFGEECESEELLYKTSFLSHFFCNNEALFIPCTVHLQWGSMAYLSHPFILSFSFNYFYCCVTVVQTSLYINMLIGVILALERMSFFSEYF